jgi:hypothetical protein
MVSSTERVEIIDKKGGIANSNQTVPIDPSDSYSNKSTVIITDEYFNERYNGY